MVTSRLVPTAPRLKSFCLISRLHLTAILVNLLESATTAAGFPAPMGAKAVPMPPERGLRLNDDDRIQNRGEQLVVPAENSV